ncbi:hypothetical protein GCM10022377_15110 [Zhihengliuella alba]|uniref:DUF4190 domain-containing protein n=1 Tax=Zhihengliuella alba TaxID=547018 RepID=A0ABP7DCM7_9MICC
MSQMPNAYYAPPAEPKGASITSLVLGLCSIAFGFTFVVPIAGIIFGIVGLRREPAGRGMAIAGLVLNSIMIVGWILLLLFLLPFLAMALFGAM